MGFGIGFHAAPLYWHMPLRRPRRRNGQHGFIVSMFILAFWCYYWLFYGLFIVVKYTAVVVWWLSREAWSWWQRRQGRLVDDPPTQPIPVYRDPYVR